MTAGVQGQAEFEIKVNGKTPPHAVNMWNYVKLVERAIDYCVPFLELSVRDARASTVKDYQIAEGSIITLMMKRNERDKAEEMEFVAVAPVETMRLGEGDHNQTWVCLLNVPKYFSDVTTMATTGSSSKAIEDLAGRVGLKPDVDPTNDEQIWRNLKRVNASYAKKICAHGWKDKTSVMVLAVTAKDKRLQYKDLTKAFQKKHVCRFVLGNVGDVSSSDVPVYLVEQDRSSSNAGVTNAAFNYNMQTHSTSYGKEAPDKYDKVSVKKSGGKNLHMNKRMKGEVTKARVEHFPFLDNNNVHKNYYSASYQNARGLALYSEFLAVLVPVQTNCTLLDVVTVEEGLAQLDTTRSQRSGRYLVVAKGRHIRGSNYVEKVLLMRNTVNEKSRDTQLL